MTVAIRLCPPGNGIVSAVPGARWSSAQAFVFAAVASVGLGNIWRFPYLVSRHGGGAFLLVYVVALLLFALPILMAEVMIGRRGRSHPAQCFGGVALDEGRTCRWGLTAFAGSLAGLILLSAYSVSAGWAVTTLSCLATGRSLAPAEPATAASGPAALLGSPFVLIAGQALVLWIAVRVTARGLHRGLEPVQARLPLVLLPILALLFGLCAAATDQLRQAIVVVFIPDFTRLGWWGGFEAVRLAFLTLGLGVGSMISFGAGLPEGASILRNAAKVVCLDLVLTLCATVAIYTVLLAGGGFPDRGPALLFVAIPAALRGLWLAGPIAAAFYSFLLLAGLGSLVAILHPLVEHLVGATGLSRRRAAQLAGGMAWFIGAIVIAPGLIGRPGASQLVLLESLRGIGVDILVPVAALGAVLFVGWAVSRRTSRTELALPRGRWFVMWRWLIRFPVPVALAAVLGGGVLELLFG